MVGKREATRQDLKRRIFEAARARIAARGLDGANARDITSDAGCGLGTIYKCYSDLDELILYVNSATLQQLDAELAQAIEPNAKPLDNLLALASAYLDFALRNGPGWSALFKHRLPVDAEVPDWHIKDHQSLFRHVMGPLAVVDSSLSEAQLFRRSRSIFAAVHGVIALSLEGKFVGVERAELKIEIDAIVRALVVGLGYTGQANGVRSET